LGDRAEVLAPACGGFAIFFRVKKINLASEWVSQI
jgi:hypothetical protein